MRSLVGNHVHFPIISGAALFHAIFSMSNYLNLIEGTQQKEARNPMECDYQQEKATREKERVIFTIKAVIMQPVLMREHTLEYVIQFFYIETNFIFTLNG